MAVAAAPVDNLEMHRAHVQNREARGRGVSPDLVQDRKARRDRDQGRNPLRREVAQGVDRLVQAVVALEAGVVAEVAAAKAEVGLIRPHQPGAEDRAGMVVVPTAEVDGREATRNRYLVPVDQRVINGLHTKFFCVKFNGTHNYIVGMPAFSVLIAR